MIYFYSALAAIVPMFIYLVIIRKFYRYDRELFKLVLLNFLWGGLGAVILTLIFGTIFNNFVSFFIIEKSKLGSIQTIILAPIVEEIIKGLFLLVTINNKKFNNLTDGIVYGGAIGLGFGITENFLYFITYGSTLNEWIFLVIIRTLFSAIMHCAATAVFGAFTGYAKFMTGIRRVTITLAGLSLAIIFHSTWNLSVSYNSTILAGVITMVFAIVVFISVFSFSVFNGKK